MFQFREEEAGDLGRSMHPRASQAHLGLGSIIGRWMALITLWGDNCLSPRAYRMCGPGACGMGVPATYQLQPLARHRKR